MDPSTTLRLVPLTSVYDLTAGSRGALIHGSLSNSATGRTLHQIYSGVGRTIGGQANRAAHIFGFGPSSVTERIEAFFGTGCREAQLEGLRTNAIVFPELERDCSKLVVYSLPTQVQAFKSIVRIITRFPGTRSLFLKSKHFGRGRNNVAVVTALWARPDGTNGPNWHFYCDFAAACLCEDDISGILDNISTQCLAFVNGDSGGFSVIERLLVAVECRDCSTFSGPLALRYLVGILELPTFWHGLTRFALVLQDLGLGSIDIEELRDSPTDTEGVDFLGAAILTGICGSDIAGMRAENDSVVSEHPGSESQSIAELQHESSIEDTGTDAGSVKAAAGSCRTTSAEFRLDLNIDEDWRFDTGLLTRSNSDTSSTLSAASERTGSTWNSEPSELWANEGPDGCGLLNRETWEKLNRLLKDGPEQETILALPTARFLSASNECRLERWSRVPGDHIDDNLVSVRQQWIVGDLTQ
ncbi:hypothetical protein C8R44DRAFT_903325 [Mycena epipterygia]|nr:hypothetical protein C8R44DRAFT_903325 [Mycena epipterygia]